MPAGDDDFGLPSGTVGAGELDEDGAARLARIASLGDDELLMAHARMRHPSVAAGRVLFEIELEMARRGLSFN